ncbi:MAG: GDP-L-fucose synthase [Acidobacteriota bacterium]|nr:GDP-L-fucose synthase [Acidobacteriota bacterium]
MNRQDRIFVAGHRGLVGSAMVRRLESEGFSNLILRTRRELDLTEQDDVRRFFERERPEYVFLAAAKVGGILANIQCGADFVRENLLVQCNVIDAAYRAGVRKLLFLGSSCIYPKFAAQPIKEEYLLSGPLEPTNEPYAVAKIAGIIMAQAYRNQYGFNAISLMPTNLYGPGDNFNLQHSHVLPALIRKFHEAKMARAPEVIIWGSGSALREFLHVDDLADAAVFLMQGYESAGIVNVGTGRDIAIRDLSALISSVVGYEGGIAQDVSKPDGTPRKLLDVSMLGSLGWHASIGLREGIERTYQWYVEHRSRAAQC